MRKLLTASVLLMSMSSFASKAIHGDAQHFYDLDTRRGAASESDKIAEFVREIHEEYDLFIARYNTHNKTYIGDYNKDSVKVQSRVTAYSPLTFMKRGNAYRVAYTTYRGDKTVFIDLDKSRNEIIDKMFSDIQKRAHFVKIDGTTSYIRGGLHLEAQNLPKPKAVTLECAKEIYSDNSGGNSCKTVVNGVDFSARGTKVFVENSRGAEIVIPARKLKSWHKVK